MKLLVVSDSHSLTSELVQIREHWEGKVDEMIHCGDSQLAPDDQSLKGYHVVRGNCDFYKDFKEDLVIHVGKYTIFTTHGHLYDCKMSLQNMYYKAQEVGASIVLFGHSHVRGVEEIDNIFFLNPGSIRQPRMFREKTYAILEEDNQEIIATFYDLDHEIVNQCKFKKN